MSTTNRKLKKISSSKLPCSFLIECFNKPPGDCEEFDVKIVSQFVVITLVVKNKVVGRFCLK